ncbi:MAG: peptidylprolyl isomerase [Patescibacteria group bacterium]|nr:peptidylprolyl isomerase [Patescibacteria group bacterium]
MGKAQKLKIQRREEERERGLKKAARKKFIFKLFSAVFLSLVIASISFIGYKRFISPRLAKNEPTKNIQSYKTGDRTYSQTPEMQIDISKKYTALFETDMGSFKVELSADKAPKTVNNFVVLAKDKFYDDLTFHRIVKDFIIQGGDPKGDSSGGPGYRFDDEPISGDYTPGTVAMANSGKNTNGSQFFIMTGDYSQGKLPKDYVIFGNVSEGMEIVKKIAETEVEKNSQGEDSKPKTPVKINKITIEEK